MITGHLYAGQLEVDVFEMKSLRVIRGQRELFNETDPTDQVEAQNWLSKASEMCHGGCALVIQVRELRKLFLLPCYDKHLFNFIHTSQRTQKSAASPFPSYPKWPGVRCCSITTRDSVRLSMRTLTGRRSSRMTHIDSVLSTMAICIKGTGGPIKNWNN